LRFPGLHALVILLFLGGLVLPDVIPFIEVIILGLLAAILSCLKERAPPAQTTSLAWDSQRLCPSQS